MTLTHSSAVLAAAVRQRAFPGAIVEVGNRVGPIAITAVGRLTYAFDSPAVDGATIYDLASLTKVLSTARAAAALVDTGAIALDDLVSRWSRSWQGAERAQVTVRHLLEHSAGLPPHRPYYQSAKEHGTRSSNAEAFEAAIGAEPLIYPPATESRYSDAGFILLGLILARAAGTSLEAQFDGWRNSVIDPVLPLSFCPPPNWLPQIAPTEIDPWRGRLLCGEVHDENAAALGGVAGHAGLFGSAAAVGAAARWWLSITRRSQVHRSFWHPSQVPGSSRALGWDTMRLTSSCGARMSPAAVGHTGFTGTSLWIDPDQDRYVVLLSNRVHPSRAAGNMTAVRQAVHDAVADDFERS